MKTVVVVPTYNEKDNIVGIIDEINRIGVPVDILVVDDNSPDGTGHIAESAKTTRPNLDIIHRKRKEGIGPAYIEGFRRILDRGGYDYVIQMDADFSHNPKDIPRLLETARRSDVVVGSRYMKGGGVSDQWGAFRKFISRGGNIYARLITGLKVKDCTAGFKCYRREALQSIDLKKIFLNGYGFQIQIIYELNKKDFSIEEIPTFFNERIKGSSKMGLDIVLEAFFSLIVMRLRDTFFTR
jgi:dolichol-phosphate mannosyltransferase